MSTFSATVAPDITSFLAFLKWGSLTGQALAKFGWVQGRDTGQVAWPATQIAITSVTWDGTNATYTYTTPVNFGIPLVVGAKIVVAGCTTGGLNGTFVIASLPSGTTFKSLNATAAGGPEAETATGLQQLSVSITNAAGNGASVVFTYTGLAALFQAPNYLHVGQSIVITGCTTAGFNVTATIIAVTSNTFTITNTTNVTEAESGAVGAVLSPTALPGANSTVYEIWDANDSLQSTLGMVVKFEYGETAATVSPAMFFTVGTGSDGAGNITGENTGRGVIFGIASENSASPAACDFSGDTNRFSMAMFHTSSGSPQYFNTGFFSIERAHAADGTDNSTYYTINWAFLQSGDGLNGGRPRQISINAVTGSPTTADNYFACVTTNAQATGSFGNSTLVSPVFPLIGAVGNPLLGLVVGRFVDFVDNTQFLMTLYNVAHNYLVLSGAGGNNFWRGVAPQSTAGSANQPVTAATLLYCVGMRFE